MSSTDAMRTLNDVFFMGIDRDSPSLMKEKRDGHWVDISSRELYGKVVALSRSLRKQGIGKGDRVALLSENRPEWAYVDYAVLAIGAVVVPVYATLTAVQLLHLLRDSGARAIFVSNPEQLRKFQSIRSQSPVELAAVFDAEGTAAGVCEFASLIKDVPPGRDPEFDALAHSVQAEDLATIIYTSGTTGTPKGAMLSHGNITSNLCFS